MLKLRKAELSDLDQIMNVVADGRTALAGLGIDQWQGVYPTREIIAHDIASDETIVAVDEAGTVIGTAMVGRRDDVVYRTINEGSWLTESHPDNPCYVVIHRVAVSRASGKRGIATSILDYANTRARELGCSSTRIDTHPGNEPMRRLLEKNGYTHCGTIYISHAEGATPERCAYEKLVHHA